MKNGSLKYLSLKFQLVMLMALPFSFFVGLSLKNTYLAFKGYQDSQRALKNIAAIAASSKLLHEVQIERGKTSAFLSGSVAPADLEAQRNVTDKALEEFRKQVARADFNGTEVLGAVSLPEKLKTLRDSVSSKSLGPSEAIKAYSEMTGVLQRLGRFAAEIAELPDVKSDLYSLTVLEEAKESGGRLRANMATLLAKNEPLNEQQFSTLVSLKGRVDANLASPGLVVSKSGAEMLAALPNSGEWREVDRIYKSVMSKAEQGQFGVAPGEFFKTMTSVLNQIAKVVDTQIDWMMGHAMANASSCTQTLMWTLGFLIACLTALGAIGVSMIRSLSKSLGRIANELNGTSFEVGHASEGVASFSVRLSEASTEQAAALQETAASVEEINAMVGKNSEKAARSRDVSKRSLDATHGGREVIDRMLQSIQRANVSGAETTAHIKRSNERISEILKVIAEIENKTKVINDIVFQTKLLSFNASVEAARAGEHGKGFAVVAEEIGNLAQMSGRAAEEISSLLADSVQNVERIIKESGLQTERLVSANEVELKSATEAASLCDRALRDILENVSNVNQMIEEIAVASDEQAKGVHSITVAMQQMDQVTQQNSSVAQQTSSSAGQLRIQAEALRSIVARLMALIEGEYLEKPSAGHDSDDFAKPDVPLKRAA